MRIQSSAVLWFAVLPSVTCLSSEPGRSLNNNEARTSTPRLSSLTLTQYSKGQESKPNRKRRAPGAPLVDSTLLRYVSSQKEQQEELIRYVLNTSTPFLEGLDGTQTTSTLLGSSSTSTSTSAGDQLDPWMGQYNRNRIAQKLVSLGAEASVAATAGEKVQSYVLVRTARRRVRLFLRERDSLWNKAGGELSMSSQLIENKILLAESAHPSYGFDDVVEVLLEHGLTGKDVCTILTHSPSLALMMPRQEFMESEGVARATGDAVSGKSSGGETLEQTLNRSFNGLLLTTLGLRKYDARKVLRGCPGLLSVRGSKSAVQVVAMISKLGVSTNSVARDKTALPTLLSRSPAGLFRLISFLSSDAVRMKIQNIGPLIRRAVSRDLLDAVVPVPRIQQPLDNSSNSAGDKTVEPNLESAIWGTTREERMNQINEVYKNMTTTILALRDEIGTKDLGKVIAAYPSALLLNAEEQILPTAKYLMEELGIMEGDLPRVLQMYPMLLGKDIDEMKKIASYLLSLGVEKEDLGSILRAFPALLSMDIEKDMAPVVEYLRSIGVTKMGPFVTRLPPVLGYSIEKDLQPKWEYLQKVCLQPTYELAQFPSYFSYPFERVIKTRYDYLAAKGSLNRELLRIDAVLRHGDVEFATRIAKDEDGGKVFRKFSEKRKKSLPIINKRRRPRPKQAFRTKSS